MLEKKLHPFTERGACLLFEPDEEDSSRHRLSAIRRRSGRFLLERTLMLFSALPYNRCRSLSRLRNVFSRGPAGRGCSRYLKRRWRPSVTRVDPKHSRCRLEPHESESGFSSGCRAMKTLIPAVRLLGSVLNKIRRFGSPTRASL